jgi:hypothetical protein
MQKETRNLSDVPLWRFAIVNAIFQFIVMSAIMNLCPASYGLSCVGHAAYGLIAVSVIACLTPWIFITYFKIRSVKNYVITFIAAFITLSVLFVSYGLIPFLLFAE